MRAVITGGFRGVGFSPAQGLGGGGDGNIVVSFD